MAIVVAVVLAALLLKVNLVIVARDKNWSLSVIVLGITVLRRRYEVRREYGELLTLYSVDKKEKRVISVIDALKSFNTSKKKSNEKGRNKLFEYINDKSKYKIDIKISIGLDDAFLTAICCGLLNTVIGSLMIFNKDKRHRIIIKTYPVFQNRSFSFFGDCIITLSLANIIIGYMIYKINKRR